MSTGEARRSRLPRSSAINMRPDQRIERKCHLFVLVLAGSRSFLWEIAFFDEVGIQLRIGSVGEAKHIEEPLRPGPVIICKLF